jgi:hypothetical protein
VGKAEFHRSLPWDAHCRYRTVCHQAAQDKGWADRGRNPELRKKLLRVAQSSGPKLSAQQQMRGGIATSEANKILVMRDSSNSPSTRAGFDLFSWLAETTECDSMEVWCFVGMEGDENSFARGVDVSKDLDVAM